MSSSQPILMPGTPDLFWRWKWVLIGPGLFSLAICLTFGLVPGVVRWCWGPTLYESAAILGIQETRPIGDSAPTGYDSGTAVLAVKTRGMNWSAIREILESDSTLPIPQPPDPKRRSIPATSLSPAEINVTEVQQRAVLKDTDFWMF